MRCLVLLALICAGGVLSPAPAIAHAVLLESTPADLASLARSPRQIVLRFNEPVTPIAVSILGRDGRIDLERLRVAVVDREIRIDLVRPLPVGTWLVSYRVTSADSHPVAGTILFGIGITPAPDAAAARGVGTDNGWALASVVARLLVLVAASLVGGGILFDFAIHPLDPLTRRRLRAVAGAGIAAACMAVGVRGGLLTGGPAADLFDPALWRTGLHSNFGRSMAVAAAGFALAAIGLCVMHRYAAAVRATAAVLVIASYCLSGHTSTADPRWLTVPMMLLHAATMTFWIGAFLPLLGVLRSDNGMAHAVMMRFSRAAIVAVGVVAATGAGLAAVHLAGWRPLLETGYGRLLLFKLAAVAGLLGIAAVNRLRLTPVLITDPPRGARTLTRSVRVEMAVAACILAIAAALAMTHPPRLSAAASSAGTAYTTTIENSELVATLILTPARAGHNRLAVRLANRDGRPVTPLEVSVRIANPERGVEPLIRTLVTDGEGNFTLSGSEFAMTGQWHVGLDVLITDFRKSTLHTMIPVR